MTKSTKFIQKVAGKAHRKLRELRNYDNSPDHLRNQQNLFKGLQGRPIESYENGENNEIYENCEIYDNSPYHLQNQRNLFEGLQERPIKTYENDEIYDNS